MIFKKKCACCKKQTATTTFAGLQCCQECKETRQDKMKKMVDAEKQLRKKLPGWLVNALVGRKK